MEGKASKPDRRIYFGGRLAVRDGGNALKIISSCFAAFTTSSSLIGAEIRTQDTGHAGWVDHAAADVQGDLCVEDNPLCAEEYHKGILRLGHVGQG